MFSWKLTAHWFRQISPRPSVSATFVTGDTPSKAIMSTDSDQNAPCMLQHVVSVGRSHTTTPSISAKSFGRCAYFETLPNFKERGGGGSANRRWFTHLTPQTSWHLMIPRWTSGFEWTGDAIQNKFSCSCSFADVSMVTHITPFN